MCSLRGHWCHLRKHRHTCLYLLWHYYGQEVGHQGLTDWVQQCKQVRQKKVAKNGWPLIFFSRPPNTCLQYQTGLTGRIETFNFANTNENHLNNQKYVRKAKMSCWKDKNKGTTICCVLHFLYSYAVCIRAESGFCCVQYQVRGENFFKPF